MVVRVVPEGTVIWPGTEPSCARWAVCSTWSWTRLLPRMNSCSMGSALWITNRTVVPSGNAKCDGWKLVHLIVTCMVRVPLPGSACYTPQPASARAMAAPAASRRNVRGLVIANSDGHAAGTTPSKGQGEDDREQRRTDPHGPQRVAGIGDRSVYRRGEARVHGRWLSPARRVDGQVVAQLRGGGPDLEVRKPHPLPGEPAHPTIGAQVAEEERRRRLADLHVEAGRRGPQLGDAPGHRQHGRRTV